MPLYEYQCAQCSERVEVIQKVSDPPYSRCPKCGGEMKKLVSAPAVHFKGSGFYKTDYASSSSSAPKGEGAAKTETKTDAASSDTATKSETKSESKPD